MFFFRCLAKVVSKGDEMSQLHTSNCSEMNDGPTGLAGVNKAIIVSHDSDVESLAVDFPYEIET